jgi:hypothetical protein
MPATVAQVFYLERLLARLEPAERIELDVAGVRCIDDDAVTCISRQEASRLIGRVGAYLTLADRHLPPVMRRA